MPRNDESVAPPRVTAHRVPATRQRRHMAQYFFCLACVFGLATMYQNHFIPYIHVNVVEDYLKLSMASRAEEEVPSTLAGLSCEQYGGPSGSAAQEMVYWKDIPQDSRHISPFNRLHPSSRKGESARRTAEYLTFEPDSGGWNNIRMSMETVLGLAFAMGRTLVLPPEKEFYLLRQGDGNQRKHFGFQHFFHMEQIAQEHAGLGIITMREFLEREAGNFRDKETGGIVAPPNNRTDWDGASGHEIDTLFQWLRSVSYVTLWAPDDCLAAFPASSKHEDVQELLAMEKNIQQNPVKWEDYIGKPVPVDASALERLKENWADRNKLCIYDEQMQASPYVHFPTDHSLDARLLVHFYAFLYFASWQQDLWMKRFVRDHVRYVDEIQCAAARVVEAIRERVRSRSIENAAAGEFDSFHVRRGDFQYKVTRASAEDILKMAKRKITPGSTVYISTDEKNKTFFNPLKEVYDVVFLDDFVHTVQNINSNYFGMVDQLVATRGRVFFGCWFSTFTGYIMRLRGYHADKDMTPGYENGVTNSWYYALADRFDHMQTFYPVKKVFYAREFPTSWRLIDTGIGALK